MAALGPTSDSSRRAAFARLLRYARPYWGVLVGAVACAALFAGAQTVRLVILSPFIDEIMIPERRSTSGSTKSSGRLADRGPRLRKRI